MTREERVARLEAQARDLRIISSGPGEVLTGVPKFEPKGSTVEERLTHLEKWTLFFSPVGKGLTVSGSFNRGFTVDGET